MPVESISRKYRDDILRMIAASKGQSLITEKNVHQPGNLELLPFIDKIIEQNLLPGSTIRDVDRLFSLLEAAERGEACLLLLEHYSNFDLPVFHYLLRKERECGSKFADALLAIAGIKLSETTPAVLAFSEAYSRLMIYPSRSIAIIKRNIMDAKEPVAEMMRRSTMVNRAAMKALAELKQAGKIVLLFPSGTRYRPWNPSTKRCVRGIDSYLRSFTKMCFVAINGNILRLNPDGGEMDEDLICEDRVVYSVSRVIDCQEFRSNVKHEHHFNEDRKQAVADQIMAELDKLHEEAEKGRLDAGAA
jgi:hypothetical protein